MTQMIGQIAAAAGSQLPVAVIGSAKGFYIGTIEDGLPFSRESVEYWPSPQDADKALAVGEWTQRTNS